MKKNSSLPALALLAVVPLLPLRAASLTPLGDLPGGNFISTARDVSADGGTITGYSSSVNGTVAFRWNGGVMTGLGDLPGGSIYSDGAGITADGSTITGTSLSANGEEAFRWNGGVMTGLGDLPGGVIRSVGIEISDDGSTITGFSNSANGNEAFRWNAGVMTGLGDLPGGDFLSVGLGISADGSTIAGYGYSANGYEAFRWNGGVMTGLGDLPGGGFQSIANAISADGTTITGFGRSANGYEAFRWNGGTMTGLGDLPGGGFDSAATSVSADGDSIVGYGTTTLGSEAFVWTAAGGMESLASRLSASGLDPAAEGWSRLSTAEAISPDGRYVVGWGVRHGNTEGFLADLGPVNHLPVVAQPVAAQLASLGQAFTFTLPADTFTDPDAGQTLTYSASGLPAWLSFDPVTRTFSGTPTALGASIITVTATDSGALGVSTPFTVTTGFSPDAVVARYNFVASGFSAPNLAPELRGSFTVTFEPIAGNGFSVAQLDSVVFQLRGQTFSPANAAVVVQNGRRTGAGGANHEGLFTFGGTTSGDAYGITSGVTDFVLEFVDDAGSFFGPTFSFSLAGVPGIFTASSVTVTRAAAAPVFTAKYAFSATGFSPAGPDATVAGTFTATFKHTGLTGGAGWVPSLLEMLELTINGVAQDPATADLNVRNVSVWPQGFTARFELGGRFSAYGGGMNTDDFHLYFTDFGGIGDGIAIPQFVYTTTQALGFHTAATVNVTRLAADPLPAGDLAVEQPAGSPVWSGLTTVDFGPISAGAPVGRTFTVRNLGAGTLGGLTATVLGTAAADFSVGGLLGGPLAAGGDTTFTVTCNPTAGGTRTATLRLRSSDPRENPFDVPLTAVGLLPEIAVEQPAGTGLADGTGNVAFGPTAVGGAPLARSFTVRNTGPGQLSLAGVSVTGGQAGDFTVEAGSLPLVLGPGGQTSFSVAFVPAAIGLRGTTLVITSNDADEASFEVALLGIGTVNLPPTGTPDTIRRLSSSEIAKVPVATLLGNDSDPDGDPLSVIGVGDAQPAGASVGMAGGWVTYRAPGPGSGAGSFTYTLGDGQGHTVVVSVTVNDYSEPPTTSGLANAQRITPAGDDITLTFFGVPGRSYRVQFTTEGAPPYAWTEFSPPADHVAPANGVFTHTDSQPAGPVRLYRAVAR